MKKLKLLGRIWVLKVAVRETKCGTQLQERQVLIKKGLALLFIILNRQSSLSLMLMRVVVTTTATT
jgi:hypothetical protein